MRRLADTGRLLVDSVQQGSLRPGGVGWSSALRVRALHAKVRRRLLSKRTTCPGGEWDTAQFGVPINQEDMAATLLAFSYNVLIGLETVLGAPLSPRDQASYLLALHAPTCTTCTYMRYMHPSRLATRRAT